MILADLVNKLDLQVLAGSAELGREVAGGYVSDLLSHVMGQAAAGQVWITMQGHQNIIAVASLVGLSAVVIAGGVEPDTATREKAAEQGIVLCVTSRPVFETAGALYGLLAKA